MRTIQNIRSVSVVLAFCVGAWSPALGDAPFFMGLGHLPDSPPYCNALAISKDGHVTAGYNYSGVDRQAVRWEDGQILGLGDLYGEEYRSTANGVSFDGTVVVGQATAYFDGHHSFQAFRWENGTMIGLGSLGSSGGTGLPASHAYGVSGDGSVVVGYSTSPPGESAEAFRWENGTMVGLGDLPGGPFYSGASAVSSDGLVIVGEGKSDSGREAFRWQDGTMVGLGDLPGGDFSSHAYGVNADGTVIVGVGYSTAGRRPFRWQDGIMLDLGDVLGGPFECIAYDVSGDGAVVVGAGNSNGGSPHTSFIWDSTHGMRNLYDVLVDEYVLNLDGWTLYGAQGISADGQTIAGNGLNPNGQREAWIAHIPEPGALWLLTLGGVCVGRHRRCA